MDVNKLLSALKEHRRATTVTRLARTEQRLNDALEEYTRAMLTVNAKSFQNYYGSFFESTETLSDAFCQIKSALLCHDNGQYKYVAVPGVVCKLVKKIVDRRLLDQTKSFHARHEDEKLKTSGDEGEEPAYETVGQKDSNYGCTELAIDLTSVIPMFTDSELAALCKVLKATEHSKVASMVSMAMTPKQVEKYNEFEDLPDNNFRVAKLRALRKARRSLNFSINRNRKVSRQKDKVKES